MELPVRGSNFEQDVSDMQKDVVLNSFRDNVASEMKAYVWLLR